MTPTIPVSVFCYQGELMLAALKGDRPLLEAAGLAPAIIDALPLRLGALATAEASWQSERQASDPR